MENPGLESKPPQQTCIDHSSIGGSSIPLLLILYTMIDDCLCPQTAVMQGACALGVTIQFTLVKEFASMQSKSFTDNNTTMLVTSAVCDVLITVSMVLILRAARSTTTYTSTKGLVDSVIVHTIENGLITSTFAIVVVVTFRLFPGTFYFVSL